MSAVEPRVAGIVLAGGRSSRFGADKLAAPVDGRPMLARAIEALRPACDELVVVLPPEGGPALPAEVVVVRDPEPFGGPLVGLLAGLRAVRAPVALVVAGDMPWLASPVLARLAEAQGEAVGDAVLLGEARPEGRPAAGPGVAAEPRAAAFPLALRTAVARERATELVAHGERRLRTLIAGLDPRVLPAAEWAHLDPGARTTRDVDRPEDLAPESRGPG